MGSCNCSDITKDDKLNTEAQYLLTHEKKAVTLIKHKKAETHIENNYDREVKLNDQKIIFSMYYIYRTK